MGGGSQKSNSQLKTQPLPGAWGGVPEPGSKGYQHMWDKFQGMYDTSAPIASESLNQALSGAANWEQSPYISQLNELVQGNLGSITGDATNRAVLNSIMDVTAGRNATRGLGAPTQASLAQALAPELANMRNDTIGNLLNAETQQFMQQLGSSQQLQSLAELAMPQTATGNKTTGSGGSFQLCCFIFMEAYDGRLLDVVRRYRDENLTVRNRRGYYRIADKIVPLMKKSKKFKNLVKWVMTDPMVRYGEWYYGADTKAKAGSICTYITKFWLKIFDLLGGKPYTRKNGEVI